MDMTMTTMSHDLVSDASLEVFQWVVYSVLGQLIVVFGIVSNIISIVCFSLQGFKDSVNISLLGLAVSDLACLIPVVWTNICYVPAFTRLDLPFDPLGVQYLTGAWLHVLFSRVTSWITAFITVERCLCIALPLKVRRLLKKKRVAAIIISIYSVLVVGALVVFYINRLGMTFSSTRNKTIFGLISTKDQETAGVIYFAVNTVFVQFSAFFVIIVCTFILVAELRKKTEWRVKSATVGQADSSSNRDKKVAKMVVGISSLFVACSTPMCVTIITMIVEPRFAVGSVFNNLLIVVSSFGFVCESINSAANIFIYYTMSNKYRNTLRRILWNRSFCFSTLTK